MQREKGSRLTWSMLCSQSESYLCVNEGKRQLEQSYQWKRRNRGDVSAAQLWSSEGGGHLVCVVGVKHHLPPGLPKRNLRGTGVIYETQTQSVLSDATQDDSYHSPRAWTASILTSLFLSSSGRAKARSTRARNGKIWSSDKVKQDLLP